MFMLNFANAEFREKFLNIKYKFYATRLDAANFENTMNVNKFFLLRSARLLFNQNNGTLDFVQARIHFHNSHE